MTGAFIKMRVGEVIIRITRVEVADDTGEIDETDGESGGYGECDDTGVQQANVNLSGNIRRADGAPYPAGTLLEDVLIALDGNVAVPDIDKRWVFPYLKVLNTRITGETRSKIDFNMSCKSSGGYFRPGED